MPQGRERGGRSARPRHRSLAWHLLVRLLPAVLVLASLDSIATYVVTRKLSNQAYDRLLVDSARALARQVMVDEDGPHLDGNWTSPRVFDVDPEERIYFRASSENIVFAGRADLSLPVRPPVTLWDEDDLPLIVDLAHARPQLFDAVMDGAPVRVAALVFHQDGLPIEVALAETINTRSRFIEEVVSVLVAGQLLLIALLAFVIVTGVRSGLHGVSTLSDEIGLRGIDDLQPIPDDGVPSELTQLIGKTNALLQRMDAAVASQRRFIGQAAHQLRTPLAGLKLESELMLTRPLPDDIRLRAERIKSVADRMIRVGEQLLVLARIDASARPQDSFARLDLVELAQECGARWIPAARQAHLDLTLAAPDSPVWIDGDVVLLDQMLGNLIDNAVRYCGGKGSRITLRVFDAPPTLVVEDDGPGIAVADRDRVFEPFFRAATAVAGGSGLGLAIVKEIAQSHGAHWDLRSRPEVCGTRINLVFPGPRIGTRLSRVAGHQVASDVASGTSSVR